MKLEKLPFTSTDPKATLIQRKEDKGWCLELFVTEDRLQATLKLSKIKSGPLCSPEKILELVRASPLIPTEEEQAKLPGLAAKLVGMNLSTASVILCRGKPARSPWEGVKWWIPTGVDGKPGHLGQTHTNLHEVSQITNVLADQPLCEILPITETGLDVYGLPIVPGDCPVVPGDNVKLVPGEPSKLIAACSGGVSFKEPILSVDRVFEVKGDVDYKVGNIDFIGQVIIHGNVCDGFQVKAGEDLLIQGSVGNCIIEGRENVTIKGGVAGRHLGRITCAKALQVHYLHQVSVTATGDITVTVECHDSHVTTQGSFSVARGGIIGGTLFAGGNVHANFIGSEMCVPTKIAAGYNAAIAEKADKLRVPLASAHEEARRYEKALGPFLDTSQGLDTIPQSQRDRINNLQANLDGVRNTIQILTEELRQLAAAHPHRGSMVTTVKQIFPNVHVTLDSLSLRDVTVEINGPVKLVSDL